MLDRIKRIIRRLEREKGGLLLSMAALFTLLGVGSSGLSHSSGFHGGEAPPLPMQHTDVARTVMPNGVVLSGELSQSMLAQSDKGEVYLSVGVSVPELPCKGNACTATRATDTVIILDHSGSMSADNRLPFAKKAIHGFIDGLGSNDRLALVTFDSTATLVSPLAFLTSDTKRALRNSVEMIQPGSGTNISQGIEVARELLAGSESSRSRKLILLSDGEANEGIVDPQRLGALVSSVNRQAASFSTIGMGLGFNEQLMASLADWGGGSFSYLEHLEKLGDILSKNLEDARKLFASTSVLELRLNNGIGLIDAAGYPTERAGDTIKIPFGQLLSSSSKKAMLTLSVPTESVRAMTLASVSLRFTDVNGEHVVGLPSDTIQVSIVEASRKAEVTASINQEVYRDSWLTNNLGTLKQAVQSALKDGDVPAARAKIAQYEDALGKASAAAPIPLENATVKAELDTMRKDLSEVAGGSPDEQEQLRNRLGKRYLYESKGLQRSSR